MSKEAEIIEFLKKYQEGVFPGNYKSLAFSIANLFEVEGKVEYLIRRSDYKRGWYDYYENLDSEDYARQIIKNQINKHNGMRLKIIKRVTTDQIIEE